MKVYPIKKKFIEDADEFNLIPVFTKIRVDLESSLSIFLKIKGEFFLESVDKVHNVGRYSIISMGKKKEFIFKEKEVEIIDYEYGKKIKSESFKEDNPLLKVREYFKSIKTPQYPNLPPFYGGAIGYLGYETVSYFEDIPTEKENLDQIPDGVLIIPEQVIVYDGVTKSLHLICLMSPAYSPENQYENALKDLQNLKEKIDGPLEYVTSEVNTTGISKVDLITEKKEFKKSVEKCRKYIADGEVIQVVISQKFKIKTDAHPIELYRALRSLNPSPYLYYLDFGDYQIIGSSPEVMVKVDGDDLLLKPIAGTRKRGKDSLEDEMLSAQLLKDPKERAEHLMLVDLGRNDLGRVSKPGSIKVSDFMNVEYYSHVMHIVSTITGKINPEYDAFDIIKATFPAGTLSGAPKVRAMEIISEIEKYKRGIYGGAVLALGFNGNLNSSITIRTILLKDKVATIQSGAGIVYDSDPETEYEETVNKAKALVKAIKNTHKKEK